MTAEKLRRMFDVRPQIVLLAIGAVVAIFGFYGNRLYASLDGKEDACDHAADINYLVKTRDLEIAKINSKHDEDIRRIEEKITLLDKNQEERSKAILSALERHERNTQRRMGY